MAPPLELGPDGYRRPHRRLRRDPGRLRELRAAQAPVRLGHEPPRGQRRAAGEQRRLRDQASAPPRRRAAVVTEGAGRGILSAGPGHDDHTDYPGEGGLILIGNHNGFSSSWNDVHAGDTVSLDTAYGRYFYKINQRYIRDGSDRTYIDHPKDGNGEVLELVTCWPLWQGAFAPQRLVFEAVPVAPS
ncbi:MAG: sortase [Chloroflexi bacterium]|nr:MAG: sortase [Chloroflexota bacterium]